MKIHHLSIESAFKSLQSSPQGISRQEAARRLQEFGPNKVEKNGEESLLLRFLKNFTHFFALILWIAAGLAFFAEIKSPGQGMAALGAAIAAVIFVNGVFSCWQEYRAERVMSALQDLLPQNVKVRRGEVLEVVQAAELVAGDVILLGSGDTVPADCRVVQASGLRVNIATVTGESLPRSRDEFPSETEQLIDSKNVLLAGTSVVSGECRALVFATGMHTEFGKIAGLVQSAGKKTSPLQEEIVRLSQWVALLAVGLGLFCFFIGGMVRLSFWQNFIFAIGMIVANVPEGLLPTLTLSLAMGAQRMAKRNALIRHLPSVETLGSATVICTDKTGTLTENRMSVKKIYRSGKFYERQGPDSFKEMAGADFLFETAYFCHDLREFQRNGKTEILGDPLEAALVKFVKDQGRIMPEYQKNDEIPFDSDRRRMSCVYQTPRGLSIYMKGALEVLLPLCTQVCLNGDSIQPLTADIKQAFSAAQEKMAREGLRVLAFAHRQVPEKDSKENWEKDLVLSGLVGLEDPPRAEVADAVRQCQNAGIRVIMITGDHPRTAQAVGEQIGLIQTLVPVILTGDELRKLSDIQLQLALDMPEILFARVTADQKLRIVNALIRKKEIVAVTGDGVNDAPALKKAHIGIAMGISGTDVARESSDMILLDDHFASIAAAIEEGRAVFSNIKKFITYILTSNIPELIPYLGFVFFKIPLALTIIQILAVDLGTDMLPAVALGAEKPEPDLMKIPPRSAKERLVSGSLIARAYLFLGLLEAFAAMTVFFLVLKNGGWRYGMSLPDSDPLYLRATSACLCTIVAMQMANVFLCRSESKPFFFFSFFSNPMLLIGLLVEIGLILWIVYSPWGNWIFKTAPIPAWVWLLMVPFVLLLMGAEELRKSVLRNRSAAQQNRKA